MATSNNRISIDLVANDLLSPVLAGLQGRFGGLGTAVSGVMSSAFSPDPVTRFVSLGLTAINSLTEAASAFGRAMESAAKFEVKSLNAAVGLGAAGFLSLDRAKALTKELEKQAALAAAALPGETQDYVKSGQAINDALAKNFNLNTERGLESFKSMSDTIVKGVGFVAATATASGSDTVNRAFEGFLNGSRSMRELAMIDDIKASPIFGILDKLVAGQDVKAMSLAQRAEILSKASQRFLSPENIAAYSGTLEGINSSVKSYFFDLQSGVFGFMRNVEAAGGQSVLDAYKLLVQNSITLTTTLGKIATGFGLSFDPMLAVIGGLNWVNDQVVKIASFFKAASVGGFNLDSIDFTEGVATVMNSLLDSLHGFMDAVNWMALSATLGHLLVKAAGAIARYLVSPDLWLRVGRGVLDVISAMLQTMVGALGGLVSGYVSHLGQAFQNWLESIGAFFSNPGQALVGVIDGLASVLTQAGQRVSDALYSIITTIASKIPGLGWMVDKPQQLPSPMSSSPQTSLPLPMNNTSNSTSQSNQVAINIAPQPNATPESIASTLMSMMESGYKTYKAGTLTA